MKMNRPIIGITMGDPAGIGPEIVAKALALREIYEICRPLVVGDAGVMKQGIQIAGVNLEVNPISQPSEAKFRFGGMDVLDLKNVNLSELQHGRISPMAGKAAFQAIRKVIELAMKGEIDATVTAPIHKGALNMAGYRFPGHTEIYAHFTNTEDYAMMLIVGSLRVAHVTTHLPLREACEEIKKDRVLRTIRLAYEACRMLGIESPRIGVAALNPHASDGGLFGWEEEREITPAVEEARAEGIDAEGPVPADTLFAKAKGGAYDVVVAMYHDQGHIPLKMEGFIWSKKGERWESVSGVNITLGLPIIRTSVDHGTAFDKAGRGIASPESLINAIHYAARMAVLSTKGSIP
ncbi:4-hydroxythreonine-4-phosphate dehydrogenase PdxA [Candidatus Poribacteria bacterium]|nr:4-hydroxythreonine-4-phosphate dehydrogenase PdxA [Candidatus Poribacteria bacterium]